MVRIHGNHPELNNKTSPENRLRACRIHPERTAIDSRVMTESWQPDSRSATVLRQSTAVPVPELLALQSQLPKGAMSLNLICTNQTKLLTCGGGFMET